MESIQTRSVLKILDLKENEAVEGLKLLVSSVYEGTTKTGSPYLNIELRDRTGTLSWMLWGTPRMESPVDVGQIIIVRGVVNMYETTKQLKMTSFEPASPEEDAVMYLPGISEERREQLWREVNKFIDATSGEYEILLREIFGNMVFIKSFTYVPAATFVHSNRLGGLLEHTVEVTRAAHNLFKATDISGLDESLLIAAALLHDVGKVESYTYTPTIDMTPAGMLLDHIVLGINFVAKVINKLRKKDKINFPQTTELYLLHCIASHQGKKEYGSPIEPRLAEALILSEADLTISRVEAYTQEISKMPYGRSTYSTLLKQWVFRKPDHLAESEERYGVKF